MGAGTIKKKLPFQLLKTDFLWDILLCSIPLLVYLFFALPRLRYPGLFFDEVTVALPALDLLAPSARPGFYLNLAGLHLPLAIHPYHGAMDAYFIAPFIFLWGTVPEALRLYGAFFGGATIILMYLLLRGLYADRNLAGFGAGLLAVHPTFISGTHIGLHAASILLFFTLAVLLSLLYWRRTKRMRHLYLAVFLLGAAMACRSWMIYVIGTLVLMALAFYFRPLAAELRRRTGRSALRAALLALIFACGALPLTIHMLLAQVRGQMGEGRKITSVAKAANNRHILGNLAERARQIASLLGKDVFLEMQFDRREHAPYRFYGPLFALSLLWLLLSPCLPRRRLDWKKNAAAALPVLIFWLLSPFTLSTLKYIHLFSILPLAVIMAAAAAKGVLVRLSPNRRHLILASAILLGLSLDPPRLQSHLRSMRGVSPEFSDALYDLDAWVKENKPSQVISIPLGFDSTLRFLSGGGLRVQNLTINELMHDALGHPLPGSRSMESFLADDDAVYVMYHDGRLVPAKILARFEKKLGLAGKELAEIKTFTQRDGAPVIRVLKARKIPARG
ncbi:MAG: glycosyltransferase family 39 protein [Elusimicrobiota bacterium]